VKAAQQHESAQRENIRCAADLGLEQRDLREKRGYPGKLRETIGRVGESEPTKLDNDQRGADVEIT
jgi:hypothetical protein